MRPTNSFLAKALFLSFCFFSINQLFGQKSLVLNSGHTDEVVDISYSQDGRYLVSIGEGGAAKLWEVETGREIRTFDNTKWRVAISPNNQLVAASDNSGRIKIFDSNTGELLHRLEGHDQFVGDLTFSPDGKYIASGGGDQLVKIWDVEKAELSSTFSGHTNNVRGVVFGPDNNFLASSDQSNNIKLWNLTTGQLIKDLKGYRDSGSELSISPNGKLLASHGNYDESIALWNLENGSVNFLEGHEYRVASTAFSSDSKYLISGSRDNSVRIWDVSTLQMLHRLGPERSVSEVGVRAVAFDPYGFQFASAGQDKTITIWDFETRQVIRKLQGITSNPRSAKFSPDNGLLAVANSDKTLRVWNTSTFEKMKTYVEHKHQVTCLAFSPDGKYFASGDGEHVESIMSVDEITIFVREVSSGRIVQSFTESSYSSSSFIDRIAFSPDSKSLLIGGLNGGNYTDGYFTMAKLFSIESGALLKTYKLTKDIEAVAFHPNGKELALSLGAKSFDDGAEILIYDIQSNKLEHRLDCFAAVSLSYSSDGRYLAGSHGDIWDAESGRKLFDIEGGQGNEIDISPDNRHQVRGYDNLEVIDMTTGRVVQAFGDFNRKINSVQYNNDGSKIVAAYADGQVRILEASTGKLLVTILIISGTDDFLVYTPEGRIDGTEVGMNALHYSEGLHTIPMASFFEASFTPNLLPRILAGEEFPPIEFNPNDFELPPLVKILSPTNGQSFTDNLLTVEVEATDQGGGVDEIRLYHNGKMVRTSLINAQNQGLTRTFDIALVNGENIIKATAFNTDRTEANPTSIRLNYKGVEKPKDLHILVVGLNEYENPDNNLNYAVPDAVSFIELIKSKADKKFNSVNVTFLKDASATHDEVLKTFETLKRDVKAEDTFMFFYSGHGALLKKPEPTFYLVPHDVTGVPQKGTIDLKGISANELQNFSVGIKAQKQLFMIDACHSGAATDMLLTYNNEAKAFAQLARDTGTFWLTASTAEQYALETSALGHGLFTYVMLEGLNGSAEVGTKDYKITVTEIGNYLENWIPKISQDYLNTLQYPTIYGYGQDFPVTVTNQ